MSTPTRAVDARDIDTILEAAIKKLEAAKKEVMEVDAEPLEEYDAHYDVNSVKLRKVLRASDALDEAKAAMDKQQKQIWKAIRDDREKYVDGPRAAKERAEQEFREMHRREHERKYAHLYRDASKGQAQSSAKGTYDKNDRSNGLHAGNVKTESEAALFFG